MTSIHVRQGQPLVVMGCKCINDLGFVHVTCLQTWVNMRKCVCCEICLSKYTDKVVLPVRRCCWRIPVINLTYLMVYIASHTHDTTTTTTTTNTNNNKTIYLNTH